MARMNESRICPTGFSVASDSSPTGASSSVREQLEQPLSPRVNAGSCGSNGPPNVCGPNRATGTAAFAFDGKSAALELQ